jgi:hypothetical protein
MNENRVLVHYMIVAFPIVAEGFGCIQCDLFFCRFLRTFLALVKFRLPELQRRKRFLRKLDMAMPFLGRFVELIGRELVIIKRTDTARRCKN